MQAVLSAALRLTFYNDRVANQRATAVGLFAATHRDVSDRARSNAPVRRR
jgi:hypothetical protein